MGSLVSYVSSDYQKASNGLRSKTDFKKVLVYVEGIEDISFWYDILRVYEKQLNVKFFVNSYSKETLSTGKSNLMKLFSQTGSYLLICCDSDYDYLLQGYSETAREINANPYIFQTYSYAIENLKCYAESLHNVCVQATHNTSEKMDFVELLKQYSIIIYELFIWNLYFYSKQKDNIFTISSFCDVIQIAENLELNAYEKELDNVRIRVRCKLQELQEQFPSYADNIEELSKNFNQLGLDNSNAYLFIRGHNLYNNVVLRFIKPVYKELKNECKQKLKDSKDNLRNYTNLARTRTIEHCLSANQNFKDCFLFKKIESDIENYIKIFTAV